MPDSSADVLRDPITGSQDVGGGAKKDPAPLPGAAFVRELLEDYVPSSILFSSTPRERDSTLLNSLTALNLEELVKHAWSQEPPRQRSRWGSWTLGPTADQGVFAEQAHLAFNAFKLEGAALQASVFFSRLTSREGKGACPRRHHTKQGLFRGGFRRQNGVSREGDSHSSLRSNHKKMVQEVLEGHSKHCEIPVQ